MKYTLLIVALVFFGWLLEFMFPTHIHAIRYITIGVIVLSGIIRIVYVIRKHKNKEIRLLREYDVKNKFSVFDYHFRIINEHNLFIKGKFIKSAFIKINTRTNKWKIYFDNSDCLTVFSEEDRKRMRDSVFINHFFQSHRDYPTAPLNHKVANSLTTLLENEIDVDELSLLTIDNKTVIKLKIQFG